MNKPSLIALPWERPAADDDPKDRWIALARAAIVGGCASAEHAGRVLRMLARDSGYAPCPMDAAELEKEAPRG